MKGNSTRTPFRALLSDIGLFRSRTRTPFRALLSDIGLFRDRYFEMLAYLLTVLAEILRSAAMVLCG